jgi:hypothetical protein
MECEPRQIRQAYRSIAIEVRTRAIRIWRVHRREQGKVRQFDAVTEIEIGGSNADGQTHFGRAKRILNDPSLYYDDDPLRTTASGQPATDRGFAILIGIAIRAC